MGFWFFLILSALVGGILGLSLVGLGFFLVRQTLHSRHHPCGPGAAVALLWWGPGTGAFFFTVWPGPNLLGIVLTALSAALATWFAVETVSD
jgi:hypothetical protein